MPYGNGKDFSGRARTVTQISNGTGGRANQTNDNPVIRKFFAPSNPPYYKADGTRVRPGSPLHLHQDGTVMTEHSHTDAQGNDISEVVTRNRRTL